MNCTDFEKYYSTAIHGKLSTILMEEWLLHQTECADCCQYSEKEVYLRDRLQTLGYSSAPPLLSSNRMEWLSNQKKKFRWKKVTFHSISFVSGAALGVVALLLVFNQVNQPQDSNLTHLKPSQNEKILTTNQKDLNSMVVQTNKDTVDSQRAEQPIPKEFQGKLQVVSGQ